MAHRICGIDVGAYSIKLVVYEVGFRHTVYRGAFEEGVDEGPEPLIVRQAVALRSALERISSDATLYFALPGDQLSIRTLDLPFTDPRKIDQVIGFELEGQIVHELDDVVFDHVVVRSDPEGSRVLAVAARRDEISTWLETLATANVEPRSLFAAPVIYHALPTADARQISGEDGAGDDGTNVETSAAAEADTYPAILDVGHLRTNLFVGRPGELAFARTITRGGFHLTAALARSLNLDHREAEHLKRTSTVAAGPRDSARDALITALTPLVREIRQSLASFRASNRSDVGTLYLAGGSARLAGLREFLAAELDLAVQFLPVPDAGQLGGVDDAATSTANGSPLLPLPEEMAGAAATAPSSVPVLDEASVATATEPSTFALATAIALAATRGRREIDLRRGPFVYRASFSVLRQKAVHLGLLGGFLLLAAGLDVYASLSNLGAERKGLDLQLKSATQEIFGQPRTDAKAVSQTLRKGFREELAPVPKATAFDLLDEISKRIPPADRIKLDIAELDIRPKKTFMKGTVDSATAVDEIAAKLEEVDCYDEVVKGAVTEVADGAKQFTLNIASHCP